ncbi:MAG: DUF547 domain-containing protein [Alphaproteobacteria bacterium]|jgi:hypothetical protein
MHHPTAAGRRNAAALLLLIALSLGAASATPVPPAAPPGQATQMDNEHLPWGQILSRYVVARPDGLNLFAYSRVTQADRALLKQYIATLEATRVSALPRDAQMAFWINLYNARTIDIVLDHYPVKSIRDISLGGLFTIGPWKQKNTTVEGRQLSLDDIEHGILRRQWKDPRIHYAVNCASIGCPNLASKPFSAKSLEAMLDEGARSYVNHPRGVSVKNGKLTISRIWQWYREDFGSNDADVIRHLSAYAAPGLQRELASLREIDGYAYDWNLNDAK